MTKQLNTGERQPNTGELLRAYHASQQADNRKELQLLLKSYKRALEEALHNVDSRTHYIDKLTDDAVLKLIEHARSAARDVNGSPVKHFDYYSNQRPEFLPYPTGPRDFGW